MANKLNKQGNELFKAGDFAGAIKKYSAALEKGPKWNIFRNRATAYFEVKNYAWVHIDSDNCLNFNPECVAVLLLKAKAYEIEERKDLAFVCYEKALQIDSNCSEASEGYKNCAPPEKEKLEELRQKMIDAASEYDKMKNSLKRKVANDALEDTTNAKVVKLNDSKGN